MDSEDRITRLERITAARRASGEGGGASLGERMQSAVERRERQRARLDQIALDRTRNATDERIDDAVEGGDLKRLADLAERGIVDPNDARLAADVVKYDHPENRTRSVWLADRALTAARFPHRMAEIAEDAAFRRHVLDPAANPEVHHSIGKAVVDKLLDHAFGSLLDWDGDRPVSVERCSDDPDQDKIDATECLQIPAQQPEPDRPIERLARGLRI